MILQIAHFSNTVQNFFHSQFKIRASYKLSSSAQLYSATTTVPSFSKLSLHTFFITSSEIAGRRFISNH